MTYSWVPERELDARESEIQIAPHPALQPVSAWLFRQESPFLETGGLTGSESSLYTMAIDRGGFDPSAQVSFRAQALSSPNDRARLGHLFSGSVLGPLLRTIGRSITDPSVFVLPLSTNSVLPDDELRRRRGFGPNRDGCRQDDMPPPKAVIGIIDHGINIFHERFRSERFGSRVACAWFQGLARQGTSLPFGQEWTRARIAAAQVAAGADEDSLLRQIGADFERPGFRPLARQTSHGTHVLDLAAGMDPNDPEADRYPIITVTLPPEVTRETSGSMLALPFVLGLEYILDRCRRLYYRQETQPRVVINFSFGLTGGPRMGLHELEQTVRHLTERHTDLTGTGNKPIVVVPAGNRNLARGHARNSPGDRDLTVNWHIQPADPISNFLEIRIVAKPETVKVIDLFLTPPGQDEPAQVSLSVSQDETLMGPQLLSQTKDLIGRASVRDAGHGVILLTLALAPSDPGMTGGPAAPAGDWRVRVRPIGACPERIDACILRDDVPHGFRDNDLQSYFTDPAYVERTPVGRIITEDPQGASSGIRRAGSLNAVATGKRCRETLWLAGAYSGPDAEGQRRAADYSATPLDNSTERDDCSAQGDRSKVLSGVSSAGTRSGTRARINGTSVAAPQLVCHLAMGHGRLQPLAKGTPDIRMGKQVLILDECGETR